MQELPSGLAVPDGVVVAAPTPPKPSPARVRKANRRDDKVERYHVLEPGTLVQDSQGNYYWVEKNGAWRRSPGIMKSGAKTRRGKRGR